MLTTYSGRTQQIKNTEKKIHLKPGQPAIKQKARPKP